MPQCCRCNGIGRCRGCVCAKNERICISCTPGRNDRCEKQPEDVSNAISNPTQDRLSASPTVTPGIQKNQYQVNEDDRETQSVVEEHGPDNHYMYHDQRIECVQAINWENSPHLSTYTPQPFNGEKSKVKHFLTLFKTAMER